MQDIAEQMRLVRSVAYRLRREGHRYPVEDMIGAGMLGLLDALDKYSDDHGATFETYARIRIRGAILDEIIRMNPGSRSMQRSGDNPIIFSVECILPEDHESSWEEVIADPEVDIVDDFEEQALHQEVRDQVHKLPNPKHRAVLQGIYLEGRRGVDVGADLGCTESNVSILRHKALSSLREQMQPWA